MIKETEILLDTKRTWPNPTMMPGPTCYLPLIINSMKIVKYIKYIVFFQ